MSESIGVEYGKRPVVYWTCPVCGRRAQALWTEDHQDLVCNHCMYLKPLEKCELEDTLAKMPERERTRLLSAVVKALLWRGWDSKCDCHACHSVRRIDEVLARNSHYYPEYT